MKKSFETCTPEYLAFTFGIQKVENNVSLLNCLDVRDLPKNEQHSDIQNLRKYIDQHLDSMNEHEFIAFVWQRMIEHINFYDRNRYQFFSQRAFSAEIRDFNENLVILYGNVDFVVAQGNKEPKNCFFFLHQDQTQNNYELDAKGHLLASMVAAQNQEVVYGCLMVGSWVYFASLEKRNYSISTGFDIKSGDFYDILNILRKIKQEIDKNINKKGNLLHFNFEDLEEDNSDGWSDKEMMLALKKIGV